MIKEMPKIDWEKTARNLAYLRTSNENLKKNVCRLLNQDCVGDCNKCSPIDRTNVKVEQKELAQVFFTGSTAIANWELGKNKPSIEAILYYQKLCECELDEVLIFE